MKSPITIVNFILLISVFTLGFFSYHQIDHFDEASAENVQTLNLLNYQLTPIALSELIINDHPDLILIDIRNQQDWQEYHLPQSNHLPVRLFEESFENGSFNHRSLYVLISNDGYDALKFQHALFTRGWNNVKVLQGGMHAWFDQIIELKSPSEKANTQEIENYLHRKGAAMYFGVRNLPDYPEIKRPPVPIMKKKEPAKVVTKKKKKKRMPEGGC